MELNLKQLNKKAAGKVTVSDSIFATEYNEPLIHQALTAFMSGSRAGTKAQKTRSDVSGGGKKPWKQKGTGRARSGTTRSPIWRGGGVTFAARPRDYSQKLNKKMYRGAMRSILAELVRQDRLIFIDEFSADVPKTKDMVARLKSLELSDVLIVTSEVTENLYLSTRNIAHVDVVDTEEINPYVLIGYNKILMTQDALARVEELLA
ncbi:MAG: large subunit ribosomal protein L4 [Gammaproteobacteria bacterium]|jgi:large subunit ribosomal protein L4